MVSREVRNPIAQHGVNFIHGWRRTSQVGIIRSALLITAILASTLSLGAQVTVPTARYNNQRTSVNANETILTPANVNSTNFGKLFSQSVLGYVFAQPLYVPNVTIGGVAHNVVYVATEHDSVYAFDADSNTGANASPLWQTTFLSSGVTTVPSTANNCGDILPEYGVTGTPVIDTSTNTLYVVAETLENSGSTFMSRIHALDITTGLEKPGSPFPISASVTVPGQSAVTFQSKVQGQRPGLLLYNGVVYIGYASHCDNNGWRGWILGYSYNQTNFSQVFVFSTEPSSTTGVGGGIWMAGQGLSMDMGSNLFAATGNGQFDTTHNPPINFGDSIFRIDLSIGPTVQDYFTPYTQSTLDLNDADLGSGGMAMLFNQSGPNPSLLVQAGKDGVIHVVNQTNMGQYNSSSDNIVQEASGIGSLYSSPVYFNGKVYFWADSDIVKAYTVTNGRLSTAPTDSGVDYFYFPGATPTISANGTSNAILWALNGDGWVDGSGPNNPAVLYAYNAANLAAGSLYNSNENLTRDNPGGAIKFAVPTVANGKVYVGEAGELSVFGELGSSAPTITSANSTTFSVGTNGTFTVMATGTPTPTLTETGTLPSGVTFVANANGTATLSGTPAPGTSGTYPVTFTASNGIGTPANQTFTLTVNMAQTAPTITSASSTTFTVGGTGSFTVTTTGDPAPSITEAGALPSGMMFVANANGTATLSGTPVAGTGGTYPLTFTASNGVGTPASQAFTLTVDQAPAITSANNTTFAVGVAGTFTVSTTGTPTPNLSETGALPSGVTFTDNGDGKGNGFATLSGTPAPGTAGTYTFTIIAANGVGTAASQAFTLTVSAAGSGTPPAFTSANNTTFAVGTVELFLVTTTGSPSPALTETGALPSGVTFADNGNGTGALGGTPAAGTGGTYSFTFTANNGVGTPASQPFTLTVDQGPTITSANNNTFAIGATQTFTVTTTGTPTASVTESGALPSGVTFTANANGTGTLSGTPAAGTSGTYPLTFTASNGIGNAAQQSFTLTVNQGPAITSLSVTSGAAGTPVTITGANFGSTGTVTFNGITAAVTTWTATSIATSVPVGATTGSVVVTTGGLSSNGVLFTVTYNCGETGQTGIDKNNDDWGFASPCVTGNAANGFTAASIQFWSAGSVSTAFDLGVYADASGTPGTLLCHTGSNTMTPATGWNNISLSGKSCPTLAPNTRYWLGYITGSDAIQQGVITGTCPGTSLNAVYTNSQLGNAVLPNPFGATAGTPFCYSIYLVLNSIAGTPTITNLSTTSGSVGTAVTITGTNFGSSQGTSTVKFNGTAATATTWTATSIATSVPAGATTGNVIVTVGGVLSNGVNFTVSSTPSITSATTANGTVGTAFSYQITATNSPTSYGATGLPSGLSVNTTSGLISGMPTTAGTSTVTLSATNSSGTGNATLTLTIGVGAPVITSATTAGGTVGTAFSYQITATNSPTSYGATGLPAGLSVNTTSGLISGTPTAAGTSTVTLSATNSTGTGNATLTLTITVGAPVVTSATTANGTVGTAFSYQIIATNSPTSYGATGLPAGLSVNTTSGLISGTPTAAGTSTVTLSATNSTGTGNATLTLTNTVGAPVVTSATSANGTVGTAFSYQIIATNSPTSYGATGLPAGLSVNTTSGLISGTPTAAGTSTVTLSATNASGTGHATLTLTIAVAAPVITSATTANGTVGTAFSYQITATNTPTSYGATGLPAGLSVNTTSGLISGTPTASGTSTVTLSATNSTGTGQATLTLTVAVAAPVITSATTANGTVGTAFSYQITATNSPTSYGATGLPAGLSVNTTSGLISGTPTASGTSTVTLSATNAGGTGHATLTLTIAVAAPVITSATTASGTVGTAFSYQITATNTPTSYGATGLPAGLSVNTTSGLISGTPTTAATSTVTLSATNAGGTGQATLTLTITAAAPVITSATTANGTVGTAFSYQITATNAPTSYGATGLPAGLSVNTTSGLISGTPTTAATSTITLSATNSTGTGHATLTLTVTTGGVVSSVQTIAAQASSSAASLSLSFVTNTAAGDLIMVAFDYDTNTVPSSVTDSQGNTFTQVGSQLTSPGGTRSVVYYAKNIKGGADKVTVNLSGTSAWIELYLSEYTGVNQTNPIDVQAGAAGSAGAVSSGSATTTAAGDIVYGSCVGDWVCAAGTGFTARSNFLGNLIEDEVVGAAGSYAATGSANNGWTMQMVAIKHN